MPTSTLARVVHRTVLRPGVRAAATVNTTSRHFFLPTTVIPIQQRSPHYQQRFATADSSKRGSSGSSSSSRGSGSGGTGTEKNAAEILAADIDADLDYPIEMDEKYSTTSWSDASSAGGGKSASPSSTAKTTASGSGIGSEQSPGRADNTLFYLAMGLIGLTGAYIVLKPNPSSTSSVEPRVDAKSSSSQPQHDSQARRP